MTTRARGGVVAGGSDRWGTWIETSKRASFSALRWLVAGLAALLLLLPACSNPAAPPPADRPRVGGLCRCRRPSLVAVWGSRLHQTFTGASPSGMAGRLRSRSPPWGGGPLPLQRCFSSSCWCSPTWRPTAHWNQPLQARAVDWWVGAGSTLLAGAGWQGCCIGNRLAVIALTGWLLLPPIPGNARRSEKRAVATRIARVL